MTMKMIRSTSITSTIGVTLMFELTFLPSSRFEIAIALNSRRPFLIRLLSYSASPKFVPRLPRWQPEPLS